MSKELLEDVRRLSGMPESRNAGLKGEDLYNKFKEIVKTKTAASIGGAMVDLFSASVVVQVADSLKPRNREKLLSFPVRKVIEVSYKVAS